MAHKITWFKTTERFIYVGHLKSSMDATAVIEVNVLKKAQNEREWHLWARVKILIAGTAGSVKTENTLGAFVICCCENSNLRHWNPLLVNEHFSVNESALHLYSSHSKIK